MRKILILILTSLALTEVQAQFIEEKSHDVSLGVAMSAPYDKMDFLQSPGVYAQGEYVLSPASWIDFRPYAGLILTKFKKDDPDEVQERYRSSANAILIGGKTRITAPVPIVAPYFEIGLGASLGSFETFTPTTSVEESGVRFHVPVSLGLELGFTNNVNIGVTYFFHNDLRQFIGAAAIGFSFPVDYYY